jgi:hypothetical protein
MGVHKKHRTYRFPEEELSMLAKIQAAISLFVEDESSTLRFCVRLVHALLFTPMTVRDVFDMIQRLHCPTLCHAQLSIDFPQPAAVASFRPNIWREKESA